ncbi:MAG: hypothetical protein ACHP84_11560 [Caulobacterales bacterium]
MGLFGKSTFLDRDLEAWTLETWAWLMRNLGGVERLCARPLVTANRAFYPPTETEGHERALYIFDLTKRLMGLGDWPCTLEAFDRPPASVRVAQYAVIQSTGAPNGTFRIEDGEVFISYASDLAERPRELIATLAHELAHYIICTVREPIPGGREVHELTTELTVAFAGFGVFAANHAFEFSGYQGAGGHGWRSRHSGYFSERTWAFALALFTTLRSDDAGLETLKRNVADLTKQARRYLTRNGSLVAPLMEIQ